jgi:hypothetical protein
VFTGKLFAEVQFSAAVSTDRIQLGKSFSLTLTTNVSLPRLDSINLDELSKDFHVNTDNNISDDQRNGGQSWKLRLSPYQQGKLMIPTLFFNGVKSTFIPIQVAMPVDNKTGTPIVVGSQLSTHQPWTRQQVLFTFRVETLMPDAQFNTDPVEGKDLIAQVLKTQSTYQDEQKLTHHYTTGWAFFALTAGKQQIKLPPLTLTRDGVVTHRFFHRPIVLEVKPLPVYIPSTIPVGQLALQHADQQRYLIQGRLTNYQFSLIGQNLLTDFMPDMTQQVRSSSDVRFYPETTRTSQTNKTNGIVSRVDYRIPFKPLNQGYAQLEDFKLAFFEPDSGRLMTRDSPAIHTLALNKWLVWSFLIMSAVIVSYYFIRLFKYFVKIYKRLSLRQQAIKLLSPDCSIHDLRKAIALLSMANGHPANTTPSRWFNQISTSVACIDTKLMTNLNQLCYKAQPASVPLTVRKNLMSIVLTESVLLRYYYRISSREIS